MNHLIAERLEQIQQRIDSGKPDNAADDRAFLMAELQRVLSEKPPVFDMFGRSADA